MLYTLVRVRRFAFVALALTLSAATCVQTAVAGRDCGFVSLFDGKTLRGWIGATDAYVVENGVLVSKPDRHGNIFTEKEYSDFVIRFEFRLTPGSNNGLAIRSPCKQSSCAYEGIEIQILDNTAPKYAHLKPYQYHGSVYGLVPAKRGHLKPVGEWNTEEVRVCGRHVTVILNGETIVEADLEKAVANGPMDGRKHPGALRRRGHIGFLGHRSRVEFRNICIRELTGCTWNPPSQHETEHHTPSKTKQGLRRQPSSTKRASRGTPPAGSRSQQQAPSP